jgi:pimeloyl-ACP methyl ester carboxylesterase
VTPEYVTIDGLKTRYRVHHNSGEPKLLLLNSLPHSIRCWDAHWHDLSRTFEILAIDLPGFGLSGSRPDLLSPSAAAVFLAKTIEQFSWQGCIPVGPDIGVPVTLSLAQTRPELLSGIVIFDGPGYYEPVFSFDLRWSMKYAWFRWLGAKVYKPDTYLKQVFQRGYKKQAPSPAAYAEYLALNRDRSAFERTMTFISTYKRELSLIGSGLEAMSVPSLIVWGQEDAFVPVENAHELARRLPRNRLHVFTGCGHFSHEDAGSEFTAVLRDWVATHLSPALT